MAESETKPVDTKEPQKEPVVASKEEDEEEVPTNKNREGQKADFEGYLQKKAPRGNLGCSNSNFRRIYQRMEETVFQIV